MESKRFETVASTTELVLEKEKSAIRIELQYGKAGKATELVIAELYWKENKWNYTRSQVRIDCTKENAEHVLKAVKAMYDSSLKVEKKPAKDGLDLDSMSDAEKAVLLAALLKMSSESKDTAKAPAKSKDSAEELTLEDVLTKLNKRTVKKSSK